MSSNKITVAVIAVAAFSIAGCTTNPGPYGYAGSVKAQRLPAPDIHPWEQHCQQGFPQCGNGN